MQINKPILYATCILAVLTSGCSKPTTTDKTKETTHTAIKVTVAQAVEKTYTPVLNITGTAAPNKEANLGSAIPGRVEKINYTKGDYVRQGAVIAEMSDEILIQAQIELAALQKDYERISRLKEKGSISVMDYDHIKAKYDASQSKVDMLKRNTSITAPFSGVLVDIMVQEGENYSFLPSVSSDLKVKSGIVTLMQLNPLKVSLAINEKELNTVHKGQTVAFTFDANPNETVHGKIQHISPVLSTHTRTTTVEVVIPNQGTHLKPGMFCRASIAMPTKKGIFIPINAISRQQGTAENFVYVVNADHTVSRTKVTRGASQNDLVCIPELDENTIVVIDGKNKLDDGVNIEIVNQ